MLYPLRIKLGIKCRCFGYKAVGLNANSDAFVEVLDIFDKNRTLVDKEIRV